MVPAVAGAVRFWVPAVGSVPKFGQLVPAPCAGLHEEVLLEFQEIEKAPLTSTEDTVGPKELITGVVLGAVH